VTKKRHSFNVYDVYTSKDQKNDYPVPIHVIGHNGPIEFKKGPLSKDKYFDQILLFIR